MCGVRGEDNRCAAAQGVSESLKLSVSVAESSTPAVLSLTMQVRERDKRGEGGRKRERVVDPGGAQPHHAGPREKRVRKNGWMESGDDRGVGGVRKGGRGGEGREGEWEKVSEGGGRRPRQRGFVALPHHAGPRDREQNERREREREVGREGGRWRGREYRDAGHAHACTHSCVLTHSTTPPSPPSTPPLLRRWSSLWMDRIKVDQLIVCTHSQPPPPHPPPPLPRRSSGLWMDCIGGEFRADPARSSPPIVCTHSLHRSTHITLTHSTLACTHSLKEGRADRRRGQWPSCRRGDPAEIRCKP
jgi:hypothetical protein